MVASAEESTVSIWFSKESVVTSAVESIESDVASSVLLELQAAVDKVIANAKNPNLNRTIFKVV